MLAAQTRSVRNLPTPAEPLRCAACGYEIASYRTLPPCPMCRVMRWEPAGRGAHRSEAA